MRIPDAKTYRYWSDQEDQLLIAQYPLVGAKGCATLLGRSSRACEARAERYALVSPISPRNMSERGLKTRKRAPSVQQFARKPDAPVKIDVEAIRLHYGVGEWVAEKTGPASVFELGGKL